MDDGTRFWDIAFDNIFTDMNVRNCLAQNIDQLTTYIANVERILSDLQEERAMVDKKLDALPIY